MRQHYLANGFFLRSGYLLPTEWVPCGAWPTGMDRHDACAFDHATRDRRAVTCRRCQQTKAYRQPSEAMPMVPCADAVVHYGTTWAWCMPETRPQCLTTVLPTVTCVACAEGVRRWLASTQASHVPPGTVGGKAR